MRRGSSFFRCRDDLLVRDGHMPGQFEEKRRSGGGTSFDAYGAAVVLHDFLHDGEAHARAVRFAGTHERIEERISNRFREAAAMIDDDDTIVAAIGAREADNALHLLALYLAKTGDARLENRELSSGSEGGRDKSIPQPHLTQRLYEAVSQLNALGYAARWEARVDAPRIILGYCPYASILEDHPQLCLVDEYLLETLLQAPVKQVAKLAHDTRGAPYCMFIVHESHKPG